MPENLLRSSADSSATKKKSQKKDKIAAISNPHHSHVNKFGYRRSFDEIPIKKCIVIMNVDVSLNSSRYKGFDNSFSLPKMTLNELEI